MRKREPETEKIKGGKINSEKIKDLMLAQLAEFMICNDPERRAELYTNLTTGANVVTALAYYDNAQRKKNFLENAKLIASDESEVDTIDV